MRMDSILRNGFLYPLDAFPKPNPKQLFGKMEHNSLATKIQKYPFNSFNNTPQLSQQIIPQFIPNIENEQYTADDITQSQWLHFYLVYDNVDFINYFELHSLWEDNRITDQKETEEEIEQHSTTDSQFDDILGLSRSFPISFYYMQIEINQFIYWFIGKDISRIECKRCALYLL